MEEEKNNLTPDTADKLPDTAEKLSDTSDMPEPAETAGTLPEKTFPEETEAKAAAASEETAAAAKKARAAKIVKPFGFALLMLAIVFALSNLLAGVIPNTDRDAQARGFYAEPKNSLDVVAIGNSDLYSGFSPMKLFESHGYSSFVCSEAHQSMDGSYGLLLEVLSCQTPKLVVLETDSFFEKSVDIKKQTIRFFQRMFPLFQNHTFWKGFKSRRKQVSGTKGYKFTAKTVPYEGGDYMRLNEHMPAVISKGTKKFLRKFIDKCRETDTPLLFLELPSATSWSHSRARVTRELAEAEGIPFIDLNYLAAEISLDWRTDSRDGGNHLNYRGAHKATKYVGDYLAAHYNLPDRRSDPGYSAWKTELSAYKAMHQES